MEPSWFDLHRQDSASIGLASAADLSARTGDLTAAPVEDDDRAVFAPRCDRDTWVTTEVSQARRVFEDAHSEYVAFFEQHVYRRDVGSAVLAARGYGEHPRAAPERTKFIERERALWLVEGCGDGRPGGFGAV